MSTGHVLLVTGIVLIIAALLCLSIGSAVLHSKKKSVIRQIEHEYH